MEGGSAENAGEIFWGSKKIFHNLGWVPFLLVRFTDQNHPWLWAFGRSKARPNLFQQISGHAKKRTPPRQWKELNLNINDGPERSFLADKMPFNLHLKFMSRYGFEPLLKSSIMMSQSLNPFVN
jgi:hypothetical protein